MIEAQPEPGRRPATTPPVRESPVLTEEPAHAGPAPVFADRSGRRARRLRAAAIATTALCATYVTVVAAGALAGPVGPSAAPVLLPAPSSSAPPAVIPAPRLDAEVVPEPEVTTTTRASRTTTPRARATTTPRRARVAPRVPAVDPPVVRAPAAAPVEPAAPARPAAPADDAGANAAPVDGPEA